MSRDGDEVTSSAGDKESVPVFILTCTFGIIISEKTFVYVETARIWQPTWSLAATNKPRQTDRYKKWRQNRYYDVDAILVEKLVIAK